jgi:crotonobetainyl-CoA:carnitine CoA-transferase CaiB-like acyl-CoA transferase
MVPGGVFLAGAEPNLFRCKDGYVVCPPIGGTEGWDAMVEWMDKEGYAGELKGEEFKDPEVRRKRADYLIHMWETFLQTRTKAEVVEKMQASRLPCLPVNSVRDILEDPQLEVRGFFQEVYHPQLGRRVKYPGPPFKFSETPCRLERAPFLGEHNVEVYHRELGIPLERLETLREAGVI